MDRLTPDDVEKIRDGILLTLTAASSFHKTKVERLRSLLANSPNQMKNMRDVLKKYRKHRDDGTEKYTKLIKDLIKNPTGEAVANEIKMAT